MSAMPNGTYRDHWITDIQRHRIPTFSPEADALAQDALRLAGDAERRKLDDAIETLLVASSRQTDWLLDPSRYLADFDSRTAQKIEAALAEYVASARSEARNRGWEV
jgi:hypothetical protein